MRGAAWLLGGLVVVGCGNSLPHPPYSPQATTALSPIDLAPPPGRIEVVPPRPPGADAWVDGEWIQRRGRWYWLLGRWVKLPAGATYSPWVVVRASDGTPFYAASVWKGADGKAIPDPEPLALATASGEAVVDPEGDREPSTGRNIKTAPPTRRHVEESDGGSPAPTPP